MIVYCITNKINGKQYVGQTIRPLTERMFEHTHNRDNSAIDNALRKYGRENFTVEVIDIATSAEELNEKEKYWIERLNTRVTGYNIREGGSRGRHSIESREKLRLSWTPLRRAQQAVRRPDRSGLHASDETRRKMSETRKRIGQRPPKRGK